MVGALRGATPVCGVAGAFSRGSGRVSISFSRPPTPMRMISAGRPAARRTAAVSTKSMPFSFGLRAQPGSTSAGRVADPAEADQVAGIDRHAEMQDLAARAHDAGRADVAPVHDRRGADHQQQVGALAKSAIPAPCRAALPRAAQRSGGSSEPVSAVTRCSVAAMVFSVTLSFRPGSSVTTRPTFRWLERMQRQRRAGPGGPAPRPPPARCRAPRTG